MAVDLPPGISLIDAIMRHGAQTTCVHCHHSRTHHGPQDKCLFSPTTFKEMTDRDYAEFLGDRWSESVRHLKPGGNDGT